MTSRPVWSAKEILGQQELCSEILLAAEACKGVVFGPKVQQVRGEDLPHWVWCGLPLPPALGTWGRKGAESQLSETVALNTAWEMKEPHPTN